MTEQNMDTAPKDGTSFEAFDPAFGWVECHWYVHPSVQGWVSNDVDCNENEFLPIKWRVKKRTVSQSVFDSPTALAIAQKGHADAVRALAQIHPSQLGSGNPNHPDNELHLFGENAQTFMHRQYRD